MILCVVHQRSWGKAARELDSAKRTWFGGGGRLGVFRHRLVWGLGLAGGLAGWRHVMGFPGRQYSLLPNATSGPRQGLYFIALTAY